MPTNILMPALSPTMTEGTLARWLCEERVSDLNALNSFDADGWSFDAEGSTPARPLFVRS